MISKLTREINRKIRSECTCAFMQYIGFSPVIWIFSLILGKNFFILYEESKKKKKNKCLVSNIDK